MKFTSVKVFSATMAEDRVRLGDRITAWIAAANPDVEIVDIVQRQSSDSSFHMISITIFYIEPNRPSIAHAIRPASTSDGSGVRRLNFKAP